MTWGVSGREQMALLPSVPQVVAGPAAVVAQVRLRRAVRDEELREALTAGAAEQGATLKCKCRDAPSKQGAAAFLSPAICTLTSSHQRLYVHIPALDVLLRV